VLGQKKKATKPEKFLSRKWDNKLERVPQKKTRGEKKIFNNKKDQGIVKMQRMGGGGKKILVGGERKRLYC